MWTTAGNYIVFDLHNEVKNFFYIFELVEYYQIIVHTFVLLALEKSVRFEDVSQFIIAHTASNLFTDRTF